MLEGGSIQRHLRRADTTDEELKHAPSAGKCSNWEDSAAPSMGNGKYYKEDGLGYRGPTCSLHERVVDKRRQIGQHKQNEATNTHIFFRRSAVSRLD